MLDQKITDPNLHIRSLESGGVTWVNIEKPTRREMDWLRANYDFHPLALDDCLSHVQTPKLDNYSTYLFLVLHFPVLNRQGRITLPTEVDIFVGPNYVVTVHTGDLDVLVKLFEECRLNEMKRAETLRRSGGYLLYKVLDVMVDYCFPVLSKVIERVDNFEFTVFDERSEYLVQDISLIRRDIISYRRIVRPQMGVLEELEQVEYPILKVDPDVYFGDLADHFRRIWVELEEMKEVIETLGDAHSTLLNHQTNRIIRILTVMSAILLPMTVLSSIYGMNVGLPLQDSPYAFLIVLGIMGLIAGGMIAFFKMKGWI